MVATGTLHDPGMQSIDLLCDHLTDRRCLQPWDPTVQPPRATLSWRAPCGRTPACSQQLCRMTRRLTLTLWLRPASTTAWMLSRSSQMGVQQVRGCPAL